MRPIRDPILAALALSVGSVSLLSAQPRVVLQETEFTHWRTEYQQGGGTVSGSTVAKGGLPGAAYRVRHRHDGSGAFGAQLSSRTLSPQELDPVLLALDGAVRISVDLRFEVDPGSNPALPPELLWLPVLEQDGKTFSAPNSTDQIVRTVDTFGTHRLQIDPSDWGGSGQARPDFRSGASPVRLGLLLQTSLVPQTAPEVEARIVVDNLTVEALGGDLVVSFAETYAPDPQSASGLPRIFGFDRESFPGFARADRLTVFLELDRDPGNARPSVMMNDPEGLRSLPPVEYEFSERSITDGFYYVQDGLALSLFSPSEGLVLGEPHQVEIELVSCEARLGGALISCNDGVVRCIYGVFLKLGDLAVENAPKGLRTPNGSDPDHAVSAEDRLELLRRFRDERMSQTAAGRYYRSLYHELSPDLALALIPRASLVRDILDAEPPWLDAIAAAVDERDDEVPLSVDMVNGLTAILDRFEGVGSDSLQRILRSERQRLELEDLAGKTMAEMIERVAERGGPPPCVNSPTSLCLAGGRFRVDVSWKDFEGNTGDGRALPLSDDSGAFWFFDADNIELIVKALDGRAVNERFWFFYGALSNVEYTLKVTDTETGNVRLYQNPAGEFGSVGDTEAFTADGSLISSSSTHSLAGDLLSRLTSASATLLQKGFRAVRDGLTGGPAQLPRSTTSMRRRQSLPAGSCVPTANALCLNEGRFRVEVSWRDFGGRTGVGMAQPLTDDTGTFWFFHPANTELILKVLDGRALNDHFWVFYGALSNVEYTLTVTDTVTGQVRTYHNPEGEFASQGDTQAFAP